MRIPLFERSARGAVLTEAGEQLLLFSRKTHEAMEELEAALQQIRANVNSSFAICSQTSLNHCGVTDAIWSFRKKYPEITVNANDLGMGKINPFVLEGVDLAFCRRIPNDGGKYDYTLYLPDHLAVILPEGHPLAGRKSVTFEDIRRETIIYSSPNVYSVVSEAARERGVELQFRHLDNLQQGAIFDYVRVADYVTVSGRQIFDSFRISGTVAVDLEPRISRDLYLARRKNTPLPRGARLFWQFIRENYPAR